MIEKKGEYYIGFCEDCGKSLPTDKDFQYCEKCLKKARGGEND